MSIVSEQSYNADEDPSLKSTWSHHAWVTIGCTTIAISLIKSIIGSVQSRIWLEPIMAGLVGYLVADLMIGIFHWAIDNYGSVSTPIFGNLIEQFQGHHKWPWAITKRQFANNLSGPAQLVIVTITPLIFYHSPTLNGFIATFFGCILFSQQFHAWAHGTKSHLPPVVVALQKTGILVSRSEHRAHHRLPNNNNYCIMGGMLNKLIDELQVFPILELIIFSMFGVQPRSWAGPNANWTEETEKKLT